MKEPKFTPGPWSVDRSWKTSINKGEKHIAMVNFCNSADADLCVCGQEHDANVSLIAAAPEMYEALYVLNELGGLGYEKHDMIKKVLKKARGE